MPDSTLRWQSFNQKKPYLMATVFSLVLVVFASGMLFEKLAGLKQDELKTLEDKIQPIQARADKFHRAHQDMSTARSEADQVAIWMEDRFFWANICAELRKVLLSVEKKCKEDKLHADAGVWIETMTVAYPAATDPQSNPANPAEPPPGGEGGLPPGMPPPAAGAPVVPGEISAIAVTCRAVSLTAVSPSANTDIAFMALTELQNNPLFEKAETQFLGNISGDEAPGTFTFGVSIKLKQPLKL